MQRFLWHDYETFGADTHQDRPSQFAAIITNSEFEVIEEPIMLYCKPPIDYVPDPIACLITGITPQLALEKGLSELEFFRQIHALMSQKNTCALGYNSLRFDDEITRFGFFRNLIDPYGREWQFGNSRFDLIDLVRMCHALRPDGVEWVYKDNIPSFKLENLSVANGLNHDNAHDALDDVRATIGLAKKIREAQPKLFNYLFDLRQKKAVKALLENNSSTPLIHTSRMFGNRYSCTSIILPICPHPTNQSGVITVDLRFGIDALLELEADELKDHLFDRDSNRANADQSRLKTIHINKCPALAPLSVMTTSAWNTIQLDMGEIQQKAATLIAHQGLIKDKIAHIFEKSEWSKTADTEASLYSGAFTEQNDKKRMLKLHQTIARGEAMPESIHFDDKRFDTLFNRLRARHQFDSLTDNEKSEWLRFAAARLNGTVAGARSLKDAKESAETLMKTANAKDIEILNDLKSYYNTLSTNTDNVSPGEFEIFI